jgi:tRNA(Arg) A34 adenosine deaminase TadA
VADVSPRDEQHLRAAVELAHRSREHGNHPFGSLLVDADGNVVVEAENTVLTENDVTAHAELNVVRAASRLLDAVALGSHTLYASTEPCAMCAGAIYWSGIGRVVFALGSATFQTRIQAAGGGSLAISCRDVFVRGGRTVDVGGQLLEDEAWAVHDGFWGRPIA